MRMGTRVLLALALVGSVVACGDEDPVNPPAEANVPVAEPAEPKPAEPKPAEPKPDAVKPAGENNPIWIWD